jgi:hypothetical protein
VPPQIDTAGLWAGVDAFLRARADDLDGLLRHGLGPLAGDALERQGRPVPAEIAQQLARARLAALSAPVLLARVRSALDDPILVLKGPELAARYRGTARLFGDIDILTPDARSAQRALLDAGFVEAPDPEGIWVGIHHLPPIHCPDLPLYLEVHAEPKWPEGLAPPAIDELFDAAEPARVGVPGVLAPDAGHHALLIAAHAWAHQPLANFRDLLDVGVLAAESDAEELELLARRWQMGHLWQTTTRTLTALLSGRRTVPLRLWAGHVGSLRPQTVLEQHLERILSPFWGLPPGSALHRSLRALVGEFLPAFDEGWREKTRRSAQALRRAKTPVTVHDELLGEAARRGQRRNLPPESDGADERT